MKNRSVGRIFRIGVSLLLLSAWLGQADAKDRPPNILWITCEDISPNVGCYGDPVADTPNIDALASQGLLYRNAFSVSGVCAPSRSCIITGMYPTSIGTCHMRCRNTPPEHVKCFPVYLREAGYYCTNNDKEDYNFKTPPNVWDESSRQAHFRNRPDQDQPFFAVFNFVLTHESRIGTLPEDMRDRDRNRLLETRTDPSSVSLPPVYPDTPVIRKHWAHYYDLIAAMDREVGRILQQLEEDGLADNTIVFFYSDHGTGAPLFKRWLWDRGTRVPLIVRWPEKLVAGTETDRLVSFVDFAPTVLSLAGVPIPEHMQGQAFLGEQEGPPRKYVYAARDRMDERLELIRSVRDQRYRYIRNYRPEVPYDQHLNYPESFPIMQELRRAWRERELNSLQSRFFAVRKPLEELYDTQSDPEELTNLADSPDHRDILARLRSALDSWISETRDVGFIPEFQLKQWLAGGGRYPNPDKPYPKVEGPANRFGKNANEWIRQLNEEDRLRRLEAAKVLALMPERVKPTLIRAMDDPDPGVAYWAGVGLGDLQPGEKEVVSALSGHLDSEEWGRKLGAATGLLKLGQFDLCLPVLGKALQDENVFVRLYAVQALEDSENKPQGVRELLEQGLKDSDIRVVHCARHGLGMPASRDAY